VRQRDDPRGLCSPCQTVRRSQIVFHPVVHPFRVLLVKVFGVKKSLRVPRQDVYGTYIEAVVVVVRGELLIGCWGVPRWGGGVPRSARNPYRSVDQPVVSVPTLDGMKNRF
jgi:hypothetical protein